MYKELEVHENDLKDNLARIMKEEFPDDVLEICDAMDRKRRENYDYRHAFVPVLMDEDKVCAGAICVKHEFLSENKSKIHVWEIIWFATDNTIRSKKYGTRLFQKIHSKAKSERVSAIVVSSTTKALSFWLTRKNVSIFRYVYGNFSVDSNGKGKWALRKLFKPQIDEKRAEKDVVELGKSGESLFRYESWPNCRPHPSLYYRDKIWRNRKGRISKSTVFEGRPYRYTLSSSSHVWFPISKALRKRLRSHHLLCRVRRRSPAQRSQKRGTRVPVENTDPTTERRRSLLIVHPRVRRFWSIDFRDDAEKRTPCSSVVEQIPIPVPSSKSIAN